MLMLCKSYYTVESPATKFHHIGLYTPLPSVSGTSGAFRGESLSSLSGLISKLLWRGKSWVSGLLLGVLSLAEGGVRGVKFADIGASLPPSGRFQAKIC